MCIFLSYESSLKYWRSDAPYHGSELLVAPATGVSLVGCEANPTTLSHYARHFQSEDGPYDVLVGSRNERRVQAGVAANLVSRPLPDGSFFSVAQGVYACSPELAFVLAARRLPLRSLITLGYELCGTYSLFNGSVTAVRHAQITDVRSLASYLDRVSMMPGVKKARQALRFVRDGAASPRETDVHMMLCLPSGHGGFGLPPAMLNLTLRVPQRAQSMTRLTAITPDLCWPDKLVAIEYESTETHGAYVAPAELRLINQRKLASDSERRRTYEAMGYAVVTITNGEFVSFADIERTAVLLARMIGMHGIYRSARAEFRRAELHEWLKVPAEMRDGII